MAKSSLRDVFFLDACRCIYYLSVCLFLFVGIPGAFASDASIGADLKNIQTQKSTKGHDQHPLDSENSPSWHWLNNAFNDYLQGRPSLARFYVGPNIDPRISVPEACKDNHSLSPSAKDATRIVFECPSLGKRIFVLQRKKVQAKQNRLVDRESQNTKQSLVPHYSGGKSHDNLGSGVFIVASRNIREGEIMEGSMISYVSSPQSIRLDVISDFDLVLGKKSVRNIPKGSFLRENYFDIPDLILKGQRLEIISKGSGFIVSADGISLEGAGLNEIIRVLNVSSQKVVLAKVVSGGVVEIGNFSLPNLKH